MAPKYRKDAPRSRSASPSQLENHTSASPDISDTQDIHLKNVQMVQKMNWAWEQPQEEDRNKHTIAMEIHEPADGYELNESASSGTTSGSNGVGAATDTQCTILGVEVPNLKRRRNHEEEELNSSPIKKQDHSIPDISPVRLRLLNSSPIKRKKSVAFSDDLISDAPASPSRPSTPQRSILKTNNINLSNSSPPPTDPNDTRLWSTSNTPSAYGPANPAFWIQGTIIQLSPGSSRLPQLVDGCVSVLGDEKFTKRFEVYATLNNIYKSNTSEGLVKFFTISSPDMTPSFETKPSAPLNHIINLTYLIKRDILKIEESIFEQGSEIDKENVCPPKTDPFRIRIVNQALKLLNNFMLDTELNNFIPMEELKWIYKHCASILTKQIASKALVAPYLLIIKDCKLNKKRKKMLFETSEIPESLLMSLLNMKSFNSSSIVTEKFLCLRNFVTNFPSVMAKNVHHWIGILILSICNLSCSFYYTKCIGVGINTLLEVSKVFLDNNTVKLALKQFMETKMPEQVKLLMADYSASIESYEGDDSLEFKESPAINYVIAKLEENIVAENYKASMDAWFSMTLLVGESGSFEKWSYIGDWLKIPQMCFSTSNLQAKVYALNSWKCLIYTVCHNDLDELKKFVDRPKKQQEGKSSNELNSKGLINTSFKQKVRLLTHLFSSIESKQPPQTEIMDSLFNSFLSILYMLLNPCSFKTNVKYLHIYWDKIIQPIIFNFFFKKENESSTYLQNLGLRILTHLLKPSSMNINERNFNEIRCLNNDPVVLAEVNSLPSRWVYTKFDRIFNNIAVVFNSSNFSLDQKVNFFNSFLGSIKGITKKEVKTSDLSLDIIDNLPTLLVELFKREKHSFDLAYRLVIMLNDTFDASQLMIENNENVYQIILQNTMPALNITQKKDLLTLITSSLSGKKFLSLMLQLTTSEYYTSEMDSIIIGFLNTRSIEKGQQELQLYGKFCQLEADNFEPFVKKLIQSVVALSNADDLRNALETLRVEKWNFGIFKYLILLIQNAPSKTIQAFARKVTEAKLGLNETQAEFVKFLISSNCVHLVDELMVPIFKISNSESFFTLWIAFIELNIDNYSLIDRVLVRLHEVPDFDVRPFTRNKWDDLPLLKEKWLETEGELYFDEKYPASSINSNEDNSSQQPKSFDINETDSSHRNVGQNDLENDISVDAELSRQTPTRSRKSRTSRRSSVPETTASPSAGSGRRRTRNSEFKKLTAEDDQEVEVTPSRSLVKELLEKEANEKSLQEAEAAATTPTRKSKRKTKTGSVTKKSTKKKTKGAAKEVESKVMDDLVTPKAFDIHSFTALLNAKLSSSPSKAPKKRRQSGNSSSPLADKANEDVEISNVQVPSSFEVKNDDISDIEHESLTQASEPEPIEDDSLDVIETSSSVVNYGQIMENGFKTRQAANLESPNRRSSRLSSRKRKVEDEQAADEIISHEDEDEVISTMQESKRARRSKLQGPKRKTRSRSKIEDGIEEQASIEVGASADHGTSVETEVPEPKKVCDLMEFVVGGNDLVVKEKIEIGESDVPSSLDLGVSFDGSASSQTKTEASELEELIMSPSPKPAPRRSPRKSKRSANRSPTTTPVPEPTRELASNAPQQDDEVASSARDELNSVVTLEPAEITSSLEAETSEPHQNSPSSQEHHKEDPAAIATRSNWKVSDLAKFIPSVPDSEIAKMTKSDREALVLHLVSLTHRVMNIPSE